MLKIQQAGIGIEVNRPGAGAPNVDEHGNLKVKKAQTLTKSYTGGNNKNNINDLPVVWALNIQG